MRFLFEVIFSAGERTDIDMKNGKWNDYSLRKMKGMECNSRGKLRFLNTIFPHS